MLSNASNAAGKAHSRGGRAHVATLCAAAAFALGFAFAAQPASADNAFKYAFKDEFGRIVAHRVAELAPLVLLGPAVQEVAPVYYEPRPYPPPVAYRSDYRDHGRYEGHYGRRSSAYYYDRPYRKHAKHHRKHAKHHRKQNRYDRSCGHRSHR